MTIAGVDWGPVGLWVSATLTFLALVVTALVALGFFDYVRDSIELSVFSSNADTVTTALIAEARPGQGEPVLELR